MSKLAVAIESLKTPQRVARPRAHKLEQYTYVHGRAHVHTNTLGTFSYTDLGPNG